MIFRDEKQDLSVQFHTHNAELSDDEERQMRRDLDLLATLVKEFPRPDLHIEIAKHPRSHEYEVKARLHLTNHQLFTADHDPLKHPAYKRCVRKLVQRVQGFKSVLDDNHGQHHPRKKRTGESRMRLPADSQPDLAAMERAAEEQDWPTFREAIGVYAEALDKQIGRWVERYPEVAAHLGDAVLIGEIREEVLLSAFVRFEQRPPAPETLHEWLDHLIDPSVRAFVAAEGRTKDELSYLAGPGS